MSEAKFTPECDLHGPMTGNPCNICMRTDANILAIMRQLNSISKRMSAIEAAILKAEGK